MTSQEAPLADVSSSRGSSARSGSSKVCCSETTMPHSDSITTMSVGLPRVGALPVVGMTGSGALRVGTLAFLETVLAS
ncbi:hypothetical protein GCM10022237_36640 [Nocardioides ginsengisoli]